MIKNTKNIAIFSKFIFSIVVMFISLSVKASPVNLTITFAKNESWSEAEKKFIQQAGDLVFSRISRSDIANCAYRNSFRDRLSKDELRKKWGTQIPVLNKNKNVSFTVHKKPLSKKVLGVAKVNTVSIDRDHYTIDNLEISLNQETINQSVDAYSKKSNSETILNQWVNVIAHELVHNFGYSHKSGGTWDENYPGFFVSEIAFCVMTDGKHGSDLGDTKKRNSWLKTLK
jgi:hypothetical protein